MPRKLAMQATAANKAVIEQMKAAAARRSATEKAQAEEVVAKIEPLVLSFTRKAGEAANSSVRLHRPISPPSLPPGP